jgi:hypothetical protein
MSETELDQFVAEPETQLDEDDRLKPEFVRAVIERLEAEDPESPTCSSSRRPNGASRWRWRSRTYSTATCSPK